MSYQKQKQRLLMKYPAISDLAIRARQRIPAVAWAYLETGTGEEDLLRLNRQAFTDFRLSPQFCKGPLKPEIATNILGQNFQAPFGIAPVGLSGLMWPKAELMLAQTAVRYQIPYTLSTVATETPETVGSKVGSRGWFQLYPPRDEKLRKTLLDRARNAGFHTLVVTADVPTPSRRERTKRAGLQSPPKVTPNFLWQGITHPLWSYHTLRRGLPRLRTIDEYVDFDGRMSVATFVQDQLRGNLSWEYCKELRDLWEGPIILKGVLHPEDARQAVAIGLDGVVVSNHGGRQFDGAPAALHALPDIVAAVKGKTAILFDSGIRSGLDILRAMHLGAEFVLLGRPFLYGVAALGDCGGDHVAEILIDQLKNNMVQLGVEKLP